MSNQTQSPQPIPTTITDVDVDSLVSCALRLSLQDVSNMAMTCKYLKEVAYTDSLWTPFIRERWSSSNAYRYPCVSSMREAFLARHTASRQFRFRDPLVADISEGLKSSDHLLLSNKGFVASKGPMICSFQIDGFMEGSIGIYPHNDCHNARISCMRLFPINWNSDWRQGLGSDTLLVSSSLDHSIRLWWKGSCYRCYKGHGGEVTTLSDKLLGDGNQTIFASGGSDGTVRIWSPNPDSKHGKHALKATLYGHEKPIFSLAVAGHKPSLLVSVSYDCKVRVWDTNHASSAVRSHCCVGMTSVWGRPVGMKSYESLIYVAAGSSVVAIDLRTMRAVFTVMKPKSLYSFDVRPSKSFICTGGDRSALLWDIRKCGGMSKTKPMHVLDGHAGPVKLLHMDAYKVVTGGPDDCYVHVWDPDTGNLMNSLSCSRDGSDNSFRCTGMAVERSRIVTTSKNGEDGVTVYRDFNDAAQLVASDSGTSGSKFWGSQSDSDSEDIPDP